ncbi:hypothetical protein [Streptomyces sp. NPDC001380]|uniref:hypothetical protein n=1 Tax=Streptomyces sp. NPDC001380 TaxID=3364566 RepID=UPI00368D548F
MPSMFTRAAAVSALCLAGAAIPVSAYAAPAQGTAATKAAARSSAIADTALARVGTHGGQCKQFVNDMVQRAAGAGLGGGYYSDYVRAGGKHVGAAQAHKGDVIQLNVPGSPDSFRSGMHTAIIVAKVGKHTFKVVDSNFVGPETVGTHVWNPYSRAAAKGLEVNIWHF